MRMQYLCHLSSMLLATSSALAADPAQVKLPTYNYPTLARIEYVNNCMARTADKLAGMYQCACAIDKIADSLKFDEFEAASTFARYSTLPGEGGGIFRDPEEGKKLARRFRDLENDSLRACGM